MKKFLFLSALAVCAPLAQAAIQISYSTDGGATYTECAYSVVSSGPILCSSVVAGPISIFQISTNSNSPGTPNLAQAFGATLLIQSSAAATLVSALI